MTIKNKELVLLDSRGYRHSYPLQDKTIESITILLMSGDETATVKYADKSHDFFDAGNSDEGVRLFSIDEGYYEISSKRDLWLWQSCLDIKEDLNGRERYDLIESFLK